MYKKILVTGGTGLLGRAILAVAHEHPESEFVAFGSKQCDLTRLEPTLRFVESHRPDAILHTAAVAGGIQYSMKHPAALLRDNVLMNLNVVEAARLCDVRKTVMSLSTGMYPVDAPNPIREESIHDGPPHESNYSYSFAKRLVDPTIKAYRQEFGLGIIGLIPNGLFGEHGDFTRESAAMVPALIRRFHEQRGSQDPIGIWGDGSPLREYTYGRDMARAYLWCLEHYDEAQVLHVGSTEEHSVKDIAYMIAEILGIDRARLAFDPSKPAGIPKKSTDNSRFVTLSNFLYTPFRQGLERTIRWFSDNCERPGQVRL